MNTLLLGAIITGLILIILIHIILKCLEVEKWFHVLIVISMMLFEATLTAKFMIELFTQKITT